MTLPNVAAIRAAAYAVPGCHPDAHVRQLDGLTRGDRRPASWWLTRAQDWLEAASDLPEGHRLYVLWGGYVVALLAWWRVVRQYEVACAERRALRATSAPEHLPIESWAWCPNPPRKLAPKVVPVLDIESLYNGAP